MLPCLLSFQVDLHWTDGLLPSLLENGPEITLAGSVRADELIVTATRLSSRSLSPVGPSIYALSRPHWGDSAAWRHSGDWLAAVPSHSSCPLRNPVT
ncbi:hypothetical protein COCON_G00197270 [Conger conger]|uniref:Uncharacterized protein n=1 Tax=Conger conger TaxID=82655 RepID=A0A9Q1D296_CONCO|nr:hypothetical protein COCON_G00197270 [Conger conger]